MEGDGRNSGCDKSRGRPGDARTCAESVSTDKDVFGRANTPLDKSLIGRFRPCCGCAIGFDGRLLAPACIL